MGPGAETGIMYRVTRSLSGVICRGNYAFKLLCGVGEELFQQDPAMVSNTLKPEPYRPKG